MKLLVLGSGSSVPHPKRASSAYWVETEHGSLLVDCAPSAIHRMAEEGCEWPTLDAIWISHFHLDHCGGLAPLLFGTKHAPETQSRTKPMRIYGPSGLKKLVGAFDAANNYGLLEQPFPIEIKEIATDDVVEILPGLHGTTFSTPHTDESRAIKLQEADGGSMVFTSDTGYSTNLGVFARNTDLLLIECSFIKNKPIQKHLDLADIAHIVRFAKPKKIVLTHFYPEWDEVDFVEIVREILPKNEVVEACDGLLLNIPN